MGVLISNDDELELPIALDEVEGLVSLVLEHEGVGRDVEVSVSFVGPEEIRALNKEWRGIDLPTDVLSFECDSPFDDEIPQDEVVELGDVILAPEVISDQAPEFDMSPADELRLMLVHGMLHLLGMDHMDPVDASEMEAAELSILRAAAERRDEDPSLVRIGPTTSHEND